MRDASSEFVWALNEIISLAALMGVIEQDLSNSITAKGGVQPLHVELATVGPFADSIGVGQGTIFWS